MPNRNGTGPMGTGAGTGRGMGFCTANGAKQRQAGMGRGLRCGQGFGRFAVAAPTDTAQLTALKAQLEDRLNAVNKMLDRQ